MSDLISRQALFKKLEENSGMNTPEWLVKAINEIPGTNDIREQALQCAAALLKLVAEMGGKDAENTSNRGCC